MASDNHASYAKIGFTVFIGVVAIVASLIYLGGLRGSKDFVLAETYFDKPISGLSVGSVVNFRGVKIGEVRDISFVGARYEAKEQDVSRIYVLMALDSRTINPEHESVNIEANLRRFVTQRGMRASVAINGITGLSRIELNYSEEGETLSPTPALSWTPSHVYIPSKDSLIDSFSVAATKVMNQIRQMDLNTFWSNLNASVMSVSHCVMTADAMLSSRQADVERVLENLTATSEAFRELATELRQNPSALVRGVDRPELDETAR